MAHTISANQDGADGTSAIKKDFYDDSTPQDLLDKGDYVSLYLRCRYDRRGDIETGQLGEFEAGLPEGFRKELPENYRHEIKRELDRISELRAVFVGKQRNVTDIEKLKELKVAWKINAITSCEANSKDNALWITKLKNDQAKLKRGFGAFRNAPTKATQVRKDLLKKGLEILEAQNKERILKEVEKWSPPGDSIPEVKKDVPDDSGYGFSVSKITLKKGQSENSAKITSFDQYQMERYSVSDVLEPNGDEDPWAKENTESIRYFHFPANNMKWIEKAIQRHYKESKDHRPQTSKVLSRELWVGQQHGALNDPLHSRHMRSHCKFIPQDAEMDAILAEYHYAPRKSSNNNIVLFMPYLHWEMDRKRAHMTKIAKELTSEYQAKQPRHYILNKNKLAGIVESTRKKYAFLEQPEVKEHTSLDGPSSESKRITGFSRFFRTSSKSGSNQNVPGKVTNPCGCYLMQAAKVYEAMDLEPDIKLLRSHVHESPPLHPRRTLHESYDFILDNTEERGKTQIVYQGTRKEKPSKSPRLIMVDQLWLYILDENTIITSFPRRLGRELKNDYSSVHHRVRSRLENIRPNQVSSVYDLALIIMNECSQVIFDSDSNKLMPDCIGIFNAAISRVIEMKRRSLELFYQLATGQGRYIDPSKPRKYLNINTEAMLLREAHEINDELRMMSSIYSQQLAIAQDFSRVLSNPYGQIEAKSEETVQVLKSILYELMQHKTSTKNDNTQRTPGFEQFVLKSSDYIDQVSKKLEDLNRLGRSSREVADQLRDLLDLKQQQASVVDAALALERAEESIQQGRAIMIFTVITIIFLPLSFMSSIFGMNARELSGPDGGVMSLRDQFEFMFPISISLTLFFLYLAFTSSGSILIKLLKYQGSGTSISFLANIAWSSYYGFTGNKFGWNKLSISMDSKLKNQRLSKENKAKFENAYLKFASLGTKLSFKRSNNVSNSDENRQGSPIVGEFDV